VVTLVLGGARSGKSEVAERLAGRLSKSVTYVATGPPAHTTPVSDGGSGGDEDWAARIAAHRDRRPPGWPTVEVAPGAELAALVRSLEGVVLVDSLGSWLAGRPGFRVDGPALCAALRDRDGDTVVVSEEVGLGVHPYREIGRRFRDALGALNQEVAKAADRVLLVVAGRTLELDAPDSPGPRAGRIE
jgi:adenosylcobinamide kinase / adenosylcobinamide-phosphate guanylyltransferase